MKRIRLSLLTVFLISFIGGYGLRAVLPEKKIDESIYLKEVAPDVVFLPKTGTYYPSNTGIVAFNTYDITPSIRGYAGPIKVLVSLSPQGRIYGIRILEHKETPNYVHRMESPEFLRQFLGKGISEPFEEGKDIDGISRATVSVDAFAKTLRESGRKIAQDVMGIEVITEERPAGIDLKWTVYVLLFILAIIAYFITRAKRKFLRLRDISLVLGIAVIGLLFSSPFSVLHVFNLLLLRPSTDILWHVIVASTVLSLIIAGRFYCGWLCPFGAISEFLARLPMKKWNISQDMDDRWRRLKYLLFGLVIMVVFITGRVEFGNYETYVTLFSFKGNALTWSLLGISLILNLRVKRFWCRYLCPVAGLTGIFSRSDKGYVGRHDCPMSNKPNPHTSECIRCNRCYKGGH